MNGGQDGLYGGAGDDLIITTSGTVFNQDTIDGGAGSDVVAFLSSSGLFGQATVVNGFTAGVDVWVINADAAGRAVHSSASVQDFARLVQVGADVHVGKTAAGSGSLLAVFKNVTRADLIASFGGVQANLDAYWQQRIGLANGGVSADGGSVLGADRTAGGILGEAGGGLPSVWVPVGTDAGPGWSDVELEDMAAQAQEDILAGLNGSGTTEFLFEDPPGAWLETVLVPTLLDVI